jgi:hypothetical protein
MRCDVMCVVQTLLAAADTLIGEESDVPGNEGESMRNAGIVIIVNGMHVLCT